MKFCQNCGKEVLDEAVICTNCNCAIDTNTVGNTQPPVANSVQTSTGLFGKLTNNIGESIKTLAKILYYLNITMAVLSVISGIIAALIMMTGWYDSGEAFVMAILPGIGGAIVFVMAAIINTMIIYGFGELISTNIAIANTKK